MKTEGGYIEYRGGYKYVLASDVTFTIDGWAPTTDIRTEYITLLRDGRLTIAAGYAWDGPSGPSFDTDSFMRGSLVHDALYQLIREGWLSMADRLPADQILRLLCRQDGMNRFRAWYVYRSLRAFGAKAARASSTRPILRAP